MNINKTDYLINYLNQLDNIKRHNLSKQMQDTIDTKILKVCSEIEKILQIEGKE